LCLPALGDHKGAPLLKEKAGRVPKADASHYANAPRFYYEFDKKAMITGQKLNN
jgi:hypothetical protein